MDEQIFDSLVRIMSMLERKNEEHFRLIARIDERLDNIDMKLTQHIAKEDNYEKVIMDLVQTSNDWKSWKAKGIGAIAVISAIVGVVSFGGSALISFIIDFLERVSNG